MFNCYCLSINGRPYAYMKHELSCESLRETLLSMYNKPPEITIEGKYIPDIDF